MTGRDRNDLMMNDLMTSGIALGGERERMLSRVVALGGGTGLPVVLTGLRRHLPAHCRITAVVTAADDGGSSGILRKEYGVLPPGDIRNCLTALARVAPEVSAALQYRFDGAVAPHPVGNLLLAALDMVATDELRAIRLAAELLGVDDLVLPSTTRRVHLVADLLDGRSVHGESEIPRSGQRIKRVRIDPPDAASAPGVLEALRTTDAVILGPGSLYTSLLATLVVPGVVEAVVQSPAVRIFVCNAMTEPGETDGYGVAEHLRALAAHGLPPEALDYVVVSTSPILPRVLARYAAEGARPVDADFAASGEAPLIVRDDLLEPGPVLRHAPDKLGPLLRRLAARGARPAPGGRAADGPMRQAWPGLGDPDVRRWRPEVASAVSASPASSTGAWEGPAADGPAATARGPAYRDWLKGRRVSVVGLAASGVATARLLLECGARVVATDHRPLAALAGEAHGLEKLGARVFTGGHPAEALHGADLVVVSPDVPLDAPLLARLREAGPVIGELELAWRVMEAETIAITGSAGRATAGALLGELLGQQVRAALVGGSTATPLAAHALDFPADGIVVAEVSSGQLETIQAFRPRVAAVLNVAAGHLDRPHDFAEARIFANQTPADCAVLNRDDDVARRLADLTAAQVVWFSRQGPLAHGVFVRDDWIVARLNRQVEEICPLAEIAPRGVHHLENVLAATACALWTGMAPETIRRGLRLFRAAAHRIEQ